MKLTQASDHALRIMMLLAQSDGAETVEGVIAKLGLPRSNVTKIVAELARAGHIDSSRGRGGGIRLAAGARDVSVGAVVRLIEPDLGIVDCLRDGTTPDCCFLPGCALKPTMARATRAFLAVLDDVKVMDAARLSRRPPEPEPASAVR